MRGGGGACRVFSGPCPARGAPAEGRGGPDAWPSKQRCTWRSQSFQAPCRPCAGVATPWPRDPSRRPRTALSGPLTAPERHRAGLLLGPHDAGTHGIRSTRRWRPRTRRPPRDAPSEMFDLRKGHPGALPPDRGTPRLLRRTLRPQRRTPTLLDVTAGVAVRDPNISSRSIIATNRRRVRRGYALVASHRGSTFLQAQRGTGRHPPTRRLMKPMGR